MQPEISVLDYGLGNVKSISNALMKIGANPRLSSNYEQIMASDGLILPGVGAFNKGMENLKSQNLIPVILDFINSGKPFLGICLGMQLLFEESNEFELTKGLGVIAGRVEQLEVDMQAGERLPHVSWNEILPNNNANWAGTILADITQGSDVYFVHSYVAKPMDKESILATCAYGKSNFCAAVKKNNIYGVQFHPEKSGETGLRILKNFMNLSSYN
jgi:glutamine amidotransferase